MGRLILASALVATLLFQAGYAQIPETISYQGVLKYTNDVIVSDDSYKITFRIYDVSNGGIALWTELDTVEVTGGILDVVLGHNIPLNIAFDKPYWLGVTIESFPELTPRIELTTAPYCFRSQVAETALVAVATSDSCLWETNGTDVFRSSGSVGVGTAIPLAKLDVRGTLNVGVGASHEGYDVNFYGDENGSRFYWDEGMSALRSGVDTDGTHWAPGELGRNSFAAGRDTKASGIYSFATGSGSTASGISATAMGNGAVASGDFSVAVGQGTVADGLQSVALGRGAQVWTDSSIAIGRDVYVGPDANGAMVMGSGINNAQRLQNNTENSLVVGFNTTVPTLFVGGGDERVGIGNNAPNYKLDVSGSVGADTYYGDGSNLTGVTPAFNKYDSGWFAVSTNSTYPITHNLGTALLVFSVLFNTSASDTDAQLVMPMEHRVNTDNNYIGMCGLRIDDTNSISLKTGNERWIFRAGNRLAIVAATTE
jgi:hypothetical protein